MVPPPPEGEGDRGRGRGPGKRAPEEQDPLPRPPRRGGLMDPPAGGARAARPPATEPSAPTEGGMGGTKGATAAPRAASRRDHQDTRDAPGRLRAGRLWRDPGPPLGGPQAAARDHARDRNQPARAASNSRRRILAAANCEQGRTPKQPRRSARRAEHGATARGGPAALASAGRGPGRPLPGNAGTSRACRAAQARGGPAAAGAASRRASSRKAVSGYPCLHAAIQVCSR